MGEGLKNDLNTGEGKKIQMDGDTSDNMNELNTAIPTPSVVSNYDDTKCELSDDVCNTHGCGTRVIKVASKRWVMNKKTGLYGNRTVKVNKRICIMKNGGPDTRMVTQNETRASGEFLDGALGQSMGIESSRKLKMFESESTGS